MNTLLKPVIKLIPTFHYFNIFWNLNTEVDICVQFKYLSTRPCNCTYYIDLFVYSCVPWSGNITTSLMVPLYVLCLWCWVYLIHFLCCFTRSNFLLYWTLITKSLYSNPTDIYFINYRLIIYMLSFLICHYILIEI